MRTMSWEMIANYVIFYRILKLRKQKYVLYFVEEWVHQTESFSELFVD